MCHSIGFYKYNSEVAWVGTLTELIGKEFTKCSSTKDTEKEFSLRNNKKELCIGKALEELYSASSIIPLVFIDSASGVITYRQPLLNRSLQESNSTFTYLLSLNNNSAKLSPPNCCMTQWQNSNQQCTSSQSKM